MDFLTFLGWVFRLTGKVSPVLCLRLYNTLLGFGKVDQQIYDDWLQTKTLMKVSTPDGIARASEHFADASINANPFRTISGMIPDFMAEQSARALDSLQVHISDVVQADFFKKQCLAKLRLLAAPRGDDDDIVMFDLILALPGLPPYMRFYSPTIVAQVNNRTLVETPRWVYRVLHRQLSLLSSSDRAGQFTVGPSCPPPPPDLLASALSLWGAADGAVYECFVDALTAAQMLSGS